MILPSEGDVYKHFRKGKLYRIIGISRHSETEELHVVYEALYAEENFPLGQPWCRPLTMFMEKVAWGSDVVERFTKQ